MDREGFGKVEIGQNEINVVAKIANKVEKISRVRVSRPDLIQIGNDVKLKIGKSDEFEIGKVGKIQAGKVEVGKATVFNLGTPMFFDKSQKLDTKGKE